MTSRKRKNKVLSSVGVSNQDKQIQSLYSIYNHHLAKINRQLSKKTDAVNWIRQQYRNLSFLNIKNIETKNAWLLPSGNKSNQKLSCNQLGELRVSLNLVANDYFYFQTGGMDINSLPIDKTAWEIHAGCKYQIHIPATYGDNRPDTSVFIIQYDQAQRVAHKFQQVYGGLNKVEFEADKRARYFSIAFRFKGAGEVLISPIEVFAEEMLMCDGFKLNVNIENLEKESQSNVEVIERKIHALPDKKNLQKENNENLKEKLAIALYDKYKIEKSLQYKIGTALVDAAKAKWSDLILLPNKLIKIRAANRKGKYNHPALSKEIQRKLLAGHEIGNEELKSNEITWPAFESRANPRNQHINVVSISDKFTHECFRYEANFIPLTKKSWKAEIDKANPIMFFVESAWNGNDGEWTYTMASYKKHQGDPLRDAITYCKSKNIPVVFWNKEDPTNYDVFIDVAADCDHIFTTDGNILEKYKKRVGHDRVYPLAFAAQPAIHNPIRDKRKNLPTYEACFAGSWYNNGHDTRRVQTEIVLGGAMHRELHIYDRMLHAKQHRDSRIFPSQYQSFIVGSLNYKQMVTAYRQYKVFLNINTVKDSPTMFSRRVFEILACGTSVVSTHSDGMELMLGDYVQIVHNKDEAKKVVQQLLESDLEREAMGHQAARYCFQKHSYQQRFSQILYTIGLETSEDEGRKVSVIMCTNRPKNIDMMIANYLRQVHPDKELLIILNNDEFDINDVKQKIGNIPNTQVHQLSQDLTLGDCLNHGVAYASGEYIAKMDDDDIYGENYLVDVLLAFNFSGADVVGKDSYFCYVESKNVMAIKQSGKDNRYSDFVIGASLVIRKQVFDKIKFHSRNRGEDTNFLKDCNQYGYIIYASDKYNYINIRYSNTNTHTWTIEDGEYLKNCVKVSPRLDRDLALI